MKRISIALMLAVFTVSAASAEVILENKANGTVYFSLLPLGEDGKSLYIDDPYRALSYLKENSKDLSSLPPLGAVPAGSGSSPKLLLGFLVEPGSDRFPLVSLRLPAAADRTAFAVDPDRKSPYAFSAWEINYKRSAVTIDNRYLDWMKIPDLAKFSSSYDPSLFSWEKNGKQEMRKTADSLTWKKGGTQIETLKVLYDQVSVSIMISSFSEMREGLSYFFYFSENSKAADEKRMTLEIPVQKNGGPIFLWEYGAGDPRYVGSYTRDAFLLEGKIDFSFLPDEILRRNYSALTVDFTSCFFSSEGAEEFFYTSFAGKDAAALEE